MIQFGVATHSGYDWAASAMQRAAKLGATVIHHVEREAIFERDAFRCYLCGTDTSKATSPFDPRSATVDHVVPLSRGGEHTLTNLRCCCLHCNSSKRDVVAA
ncbi:hypothetical protein VV01_14570 [Luteipulveratus halotolerans]|uniref:HNH nuclease domain-containing protein n=1 Tax=Luteipulveratus halotolerans TaxID=1631356 RepID=A0A0L6CP13_9MICO|nr:hypothetical protein VV01_14570 [Luteipulveratus halotolerans]